MNEFKVIVSMKVVNSDGTPVDDRGYVKLRDKPHSPLVCEIEFSDHPDVKGALDHMNGVFRVVDSIKKLATGNN